MRIPFCQVRHVTIFRMCDRTRCLRLSLVGLVTGLALVLLAAPFQSVLSDEGTRAESPTINLWSPSSSISHGWLFRAGDDPAWADPELDDSAWDYISDSTRVPDSWNGIGWYRLHVEITPELVDHTFRFQLRHLGASEAYLDGRRIGTFGRIGTDTLPEVQFDPYTPPPKISFDEAREYVIAVRYSRLDAEEPSALPSHDTPRTGFIGWLELEVKPVAQKTNLYRMLSAGFTGLLVAIGAIHMLSYLFDRRRKQQAFLSGFCLAIAAYPIVHIVAPATSGIVGIVVDALPPLLVLTAFGLYVGILLAVTSQSSSKRASPRVWGFPALVVTLVAIFGIRGDSQYAHLGLYIALGVCAVGLVVAHQVFARRWRKLRVHRRKSRIYTGVATLVLAGVSVLVIVEGLLPVIAPFGTVVSALAVLGVVAWLTAYLLYRSTAKNIALQEQVKELTANRLKPADAGVPQKIEAELDAGQPPLPFTAAAETQGATEGAGLEVEVADVEPGPKRPGPRRPWRGLGLKADRTKRLRPRKSPRRRPMPRRFSRSMP